MTADRGSKKIRVIIADDHALLREAMRVALEQYNDIEVVAEATDGVDVVRLSSELKPDVVVMDIMMPKLNGIKATMQVRNISPATAVLILTGYDDDRYVIGLLESGAAGYLLKSSNMEGLVRAVHAVYDGEAVFDHSIFRKILNYTSFSKGKSKVADSGKEHREALSVREITVLKLAATGMSNKQIADELCVTVATVKAHLSSIFSKMGIVSRAEAIFKGMRDGLITLEDLLEQETSE
jgi:NarL family two-component system response regulator LiaR